MAEESGLSVLLNYFQDKLKQVGDTAKLANERNFDIINRVQAGQPVGDQLRGVIGDVSGAMPIAGMAKVFKPAQEMDLPQLVQKIAKGEASAPNLNALAPAYRNTLTGELATGSIGGGHSAVSESLPLSWQKNMQHGYKYPDGPFLPDEWYSLLRDSRMTKTAANLLQKGIGIDSIFQALRFANPSGR